MASRLFSDCLYSTIESVSLCLMGILFREMLEGSTNALPNTNSYGEWPCVLDGVIFPHLDSHFLQAGIGDYAVVVRRSGDTWFLAAITDEMPRDLAVPADFLEAGQVYTAEIYQDGIDAHWLRNPYAVDILRRTYSHDDTIYLKLAAGGGAALRLLSEKGLP